jgi:hypothetical protein
MAMGSTAHLFLGMARAAAVSLICAFKFIIILGAGF